MAPTPPRPLHACVSRAAALALLACACAGDDGRDDPTATATATSTATATATATATSGSSTGDAGTGGSASGSTTGDSSSTGIGSSGGDPTDATTRATTGATTGSTGSTGGDTTTDGACFDLLPKPAGDEAVLAAEYVGTYFAYDLGTVPKEGGGELPRLGGLVISPIDPDVMLVVGPSEVPGAELHQIGVERGPCGHIVGFVGGATKVLTAPYLDLMVNGPKDLVFISHYPTGQLSQHVPGSMSLIATDMLAPLAANHSPGGLNFVPPGYPEAGMLRVIGFPTDHVDPGGWYRSTITFDVDHYAIGPLTKTADVAYGPGGFAYIPEGSPLFPEQRIMVTEWLSDPRSVSSYAVDDQGDPIPATRKLFFESFIKPWGSYFEPETGDYMFLQWEAQPDHIYIVQGFVPPPPIPG